MINKTNYNRALRDSSLWQLVRMIGVNDADVHQIKCFENKSLLMRVLVLAFSIVDHVSQ